MTHRQVLVIDAYNLLWRGLGASGRPELEAQRARLEARLGEYLRVRPGLEAILVYDGADFAGAPPEPRRAPAPASGLRLIFTRPPESADTRVLALARDLLRQGAEVVVVSSDRRDVISQLPSSPHLRELSSERFADLLDEALAERLGPAPESASGSAAGRDAKREPELSREEVERWLEAFKPRGGKERPR